MKDKKWYKVEFWTTAPIEYLAEEFKLPSLEYETAHYKVFDGEKAVVDLPMEVGDGTTVDDSK